MSQTSKISFIHFSGYGGKRCMSWENVSPGRTFLKLKIKSTEAFIDQQKFFFKVLKAVFAHTFLRTSSMSKALCCCLDHKNTSTPKFTCFASGFFCFTVENESVCFPLFNRRAKCRQGGPEFLRDISSLPFQISVQYCDISFLVY